MTKQELPTFEIEEYPDILAEYGLGMILTTNVEYFLKEAIKRKNGTPKEVPIGELIKIASSSLSDDLIKDLEILNKERIRMIHGTVGTVGSNSSDPRKHFILKNGIESETSLKSLREYSKLAKKIIGRLIGI